MPDHAIDRGSMSSKVNTRWEDHLKTSSSFEPRTIVRFSNGPRFCESAPLQGSRRLLIRSSKTKIGIGCTGLFENETMKCRKRRSQMRDFWATIVRRTVAQRLICSRASTGEQHRNAQLRRRTNEHGVRHIGETVCLDREKQGEVE